MVRKQVYIEQDQEAFLKRRAGELGVTEAELIRRSIDLLRQSPARRAFDRQAWQDVLAFLEERGRLPATAAPVRWRREDAYEERLARIPR